MLIHQEAIRQSLKCEREIEALRQSIYIPPDPEFEKEVREKINKLRQKKPFMEETQQLIDTLYSSIKRKKVDPEIEAQIQEQISALRRESDALWEYAKLMSPPNATKKNYENLANAICRQAVLDYEALISGTKSGSNDCNTTEILNFAETTVLTKTDLPSILKRITYIREHEFIPYCAEHEDDIKKEYLRYKKKKIDTIGYNATFPYRCAVCGAALKPEFDKKNLIGIGCVNCKTYVYSSVMHNLAREQEERM